MGQSPKIWDLYHSEVQVLPYIFLILSSSNSIWYVIVISDE